MNHPQQRHALQDGDRDGGSSSSSSKTNSKGIRNHPFIIVQLVMLYVLLTYNFISERRNGITVMNTITSSREAATLSTLTSTTKTTTTTATVTNTTPVPTAATKTPTTSSSTNTSTFVRVRSGHRSNITVSTSVINTTSSSAAATNNLMSSSPPSSTTTNTTVDSHRSNSNNSTKRAAVVPQTQMIIVDETSQETNDDPRIRYRRMNVSTTTHRHDEIGRVGSADGSSSSRRRRWYPSDEWIEECVVDQWPLSLAAGPWNNSHRKTIIGDCVKTCSNCYGDRSSTGFIGMYLTMHCNNPNSTHVKDVPRYDIIDTIHDIQSTLPGFVMPDPSTLVIHLRLGDIIENSKDNVTSILKSGGNPGWKVRNFKKALKPIHELLENIYEQDGTDTNSNDKRNKVDNTKVHVVGGSQYPNTYEKSRVYANCIHQAILAAGFRDTQLSIEGRSTEHDFFYVSHAKRLVVSAGGYSNMMGQLVERRGGTVVGRNFSITW